MEMTADMLTNHSGETGCYGYGVWLEKRGELHTPYFQGSDPGVSFISSFDLNKRLLVILVSNYGDDVWTMSKKIAAHFR